MDEDPGERHPLLMGVVGSTAYGLAHAGSDVDRMGIFAYPTERVLGLHWPKDSVVTTDPDTNMVRAQERFDQATTVLPDQPNERRVEKWLLAVRKGFIDKGMQ